MTEPCPHDLSEQEAHVYSGLCPLCLRADNERLRAVLQDMPDIIKDFDGGNPETKTGWASEEMLDLWMRVRAALEPSSARNKP